MAEHLGCNIALQYHHGSEECMNYLTTSESENTPTQGSEGRFTYASWRRESEDEAQRTAKSESNNEERPERTDEEKVNAEVKYLHIQKMDKEEQWAAKAGPWAV